MHPNRTEGVVIAGMIIKLSGNYAILTSIVLRGPVFFFPPNVFYEFGWERSAIRFSSRFIVNCILSVLFFASFITEQRVWVDSDKFWYSHLYVVTRSYTAFVSKNFGLNFLKIRRLRVSTESFLISISSFAKEHVYLSIMSKNCQSHGDVMSGYLTKCSLQRMITAVLIFTIIFSK